MVEYREWCWKGEQQIKMVVIGKPNILVNKHLVFLVEQQKELLNHITEIE